jgi:hypothetical protein
MKIRQTLISLLCALPAPLLAQPQIGGGACSTATLNGMYSLTLTGRDVGSSLTFSKTLQGVGTASFDGVSKVTLTLTDNTNQAAGTAQTLSGTYTMQSNCVGTIAVSVGDTASFQLESYNTGKAYLLSGQDGVYSYSGGGNTLPASCTTSLLNGTYEFGGNGYTLASGSVSGVNNVLGLLQFDGKSAVTGTWYVSVNGGTTTLTTSGQFTVAAGCTGSASLTDTAGNAYTLIFAITSADGANFAVGGSSATLMFSGSGRTL